MWFTICFSVMYAQWGCNVSKLHAQCGRPGTVGQLKFLLFFSNIVECDFYLDKYILLQSLIVSSSGNATYTVTHCMEDKCMTLYICTVHVTEVKKEGRKKQARSNKQQGKATLQTCASVM